MDYALNNVASRAELQATSVVGERARTRASSCNRRRLTAPCMRNRVHAYRRIGTQSRVLRWSYLSSAGSGCVRCCAVRNRDRNVYQRRWQGGCGTVQSGVDRSRVEWRRERSESGGRQLDRRQQKRRNVEKEREREKDGERERETEKGAAGGGKVGRAGQRTELARC